MVETPTEFVQLKTSYLLEILSGADVEPQENPHGPTVEFLHAIDQIQHAKTLISDTIIELRRWTSGRLVLLPEIDANAGFQTCELQHFTHPENFGSFVCDARFMLREIYLT